MIKEHFTLIPNKLFRGEESLYSKYNDYKLINVLEYLYTNTNRKGITMFTLEDIIISNGLKVDTHKGKSVDQFKGMLKFLKENNIITLELNIDKIKKNDLIKCEYNGLDINEKGDYINFTILKDSDRETILNYNEEKIDNIKLLFYFSYINSRIYKKLDDEDTKPQVAFPSYEQIVKDTGIAESTITKYNNILVKLNIIAIKNAGSYKSKDGNMVKEAPNFYALKEFEHELDKAIEVWKRERNDITFVKTNNNRQHNGFIARINQLEVKGKATAEQIAKRDSLLEDKKIIIKSDLIKEIQSLTNLENIADTIDYIIDCNNGNENYTIEFLKGLIKSLQEKQPSEEVDKPAITNNNNVNNYVFDEDLDLSLLPVYTPTKKEPKVKKPRTTLTKKQKQANKIDFSLFGQ